MRITDYLLAPQGTLDSDVKPVPEHVVDAEITQYMSDAEIQAVIIEDMRVMADRLEAIFDLEPITQDRVLQLISEETRSRFLVAFCNRQNKTVLFNDLISC
jgi:hypothetical protein